jgi:peptidoglycan-associated lipoprotein
MLKHLLIVSCALSLLVPAGCARKPPAMIESVTQPAPPAINETAADPASPLETPAPATMITDRGLSLESIHFAYDSSLLQDDARLVLQRNADWLNANPGVVVTIEGHCDERGAGEYNLALGEERAKAVKTYLVNLGVQPERLETLSFGEEAPLDPGHDETAWAKNRRAAFN